MKLFKTSQLLTPLPSSAHGEKRFSVLIRLQTKLRIASAPNSLDKLMQLISVEPHTDDLDSDEITNLHKFPKKPLGKVISWSNLNT